MNRARAAEIQSEPKRKIGRWNTDTPDIAPTIAKIPLRAEVRDMLTAADLYEQSARKHDEESERLRELAKQARTQAMNLERMAGL